ncbi:MAG: hypothetical protein J6031_05655 [Bacteroidales bacterium]|nr:hypothetical protein [Bacteroidales bacterium]
MKTSRLNWPVVLTVAAMCALSMTLFFIRHERVVDVQPVVINDTITPEPQEESDLDYYNQLADEYIAMLPADKQLIARIVDSVNHHLVYYEKTDHPSCYILDLESQTTAVLFSSENGFYCGTKLLIIGTIHQWLRVGDIVYFIADNQAPDVTPSDAVYVFSLTLSDHRLDYVDTGYDARFIGSDKLLIGYATLLYHSLFTGEDVYDYRTETVDLSFEI